MVFDAQREVFERIALDELAAAAPRRERRHLHWRDCTVWTVGSALTLGAVLVASGVLGGPRTPRSG